MECDFSGWATKNDLRCADGRIIRKGAFKSNDGKKVPLVWNHQHNSASDILGHAYLENRNEGVYAYCKFNNTNAGKDAKEAVKHGDVTCLSIWANNLQQEGPSVMHGVIREVSLVLAGANPGAFIESVMAHGEPMGDDEEEGIFYTDESIFIQHDDGSDTEPEENNEDEEGDDMAGKTVKEIIDGMTDEQKQAMAIVVGQALEDAGIDVDDDEENNEDEEGDDVRHSIYDDKPETETNDKYLSHADMEAIFVNARRTGSLREAVNEALDGGVLCHAIDTTGMTTANGTQTYGFNDPDMLFPDYAPINGGAPEWISRNMDWVAKVIGGVHHTPFSRVKSTYANITEDEARAKGYIKGKQKKEEVFSILKRVTNPQTIYKLQKLDRDDIIDIKDFDVVVWIKAEMKVMLNEEIARAILIGDGRLADDEYKIKEDCIRPIVSEPPLFNTVVEITPSATEADTAKATINGIIRARKNYKGSGNPTFFTTEDVLTDMLLLEDTTGHKLYKTEGELATALRVKEIVTVEPMEGHKVNEKLLIGVIVNLQDYNVGTDKGGEINMFDDFDIDFNQQKYLIETRSSGALIKPFSALTIVKGETASASYMSSRKSNE